MKISTIVGARPQFIKAAVVSRAFRERRPDISEILVHTGQHFDADMSEVFFEELEIPRPDYHLGIGGGTHGRNTGRMIEAIEGVLLDERPDWVLVYGDTDSTLAGALAAVKLHIPVAHVEAGLRSFNRRMPEEINRVLTDHASDLLFAPTQRAVENLKAEGISHNKIKHVGDVMYDAALFYADRAEACSRILQTLGLQRKGYILATVHREENTDDPKRLAAIIRGLSAADASVIFPLHPRTRKRLQEYGLSLEIPLYPIDPVGYMDMVMLEKYATLIATDSGGVQKEAYFHGVPCVTLRDETEWVELVEQGFNCLVGSDPEKIAMAVRANPDQPDRHLSLYGDGHAAEKILSHLLSLVGN